MTLDRRKLLGPLHKPLAKIRHSQTVRVLGAVMQLPGQMTRAFLNRPYFPVNIKGTMGLGAVLSHAIRACEYADKHKLIAQISSTNPLYVSGNGQSDVIQTYFGLDNADRKPRLGPMVYQHKFSFLYLKEYPAHVPLREANRIFWTYLPPKSQVTDTLKTILSDVPNSKYDLAVHYRGTDKVLEAPIVNFSVFGDEIARYNNDKGPLKHVFLATDEPDFENYAREKFPHIIFHTYNLGNPENYKRGRHFSDMSAKDKAMEAIINMFLLAEAPFLIRSASYMSALSKVINPDIQTLTLNRTHWNSITFPEKEIVDEETQGKA